VNQISELTEEDILLHNTTTATEELDTAMHAAYLALGTARAALAELVGPLYHPDYAESTNGPDIDHQLEVAQRALRAAKALHERITR